MKNIHVLPTDKPSRLFIIEGKIFKYHKPQQGDDMKIINVNIYITSDEEVKANDWFIDDCESDAISILYKCLEIKPLEYIRTEFDKHDFKDCKKIILTTDQDLIQDGVQAIDDEFLEWFVKNPSCEKVEVEVDKYRDTSISDTEVFIDYKIIIPQEEPKQETLEEAINNFKKTDVYINEIKQKQERMYSEEEVLEIIRQYAFEEHLITSSKPDIWFEQFKNK